jgi:hypothetical protein
MLFYVPFFTPRTEGRIPTTTPDDHPGNMLLRWYGPWQQSINLYLMADGSLTEDYPINDLDLLRRTYFGGANKVTQTEVDALLAAGYGVSGNGTITYEDMVITGDFVWQLVSGETLLQVSA